MTITEKILARAAGIRVCKPGETVEVDVDRIWLCDPLATRLSHLFEGFEELGVTRVLDPAKVVAMIEHGTPPGTVERAEDALALRCFARSQGILFYEMGRTGIGHQVMIEKGHVRPGEVILAADSHTCTYGAFGAFSTSIGLIEVEGVLLYGKTWFEVPASVKFVIEGTLPDMVVGKDIVLRILSELGAGVATDKAAEFAGPTIEGMSIDSRLSMANLGIEMAALNAIMAPNDATIDFVKSRTIEEFRVVQSDPDADYEHVYFLDVAKMAPYIAFPYAPSNGRPVREAEGIRIDQAFIGSCCNGRLEDLRMAARVLKGRKVDPGVRLIVIPASQEIYGRCLEEGLLRVFLDAEAVICTPSCGPCGGMDKGLLARGEVGIASSPRNFKGRQGHPESETYLGNAATVAAAAVAGHIVDPREFA